MELLPNTDHKRVIDELIALVFKRSPEIDWSDPYSEHFFRSQGIHLASTRHRDRIVHVDESMHDLTIEYLEYTRIMRINRVARAIRLPKSSDDIRVLQDTDETASLFDFARGLTEGQSPSQADLNFWQPTLIETVKSAAERVAND